MNKIWVCHSARELGLGGGYRTGKARGVLKKPESYPFYLRHDKNGPGPAGFGKTNVQGVATIMALAVSKNLTPVCGPGIPSYYSSQEAEEKINDY